MHTTTSTRASWALALLVSVGTASGFQSPSFDSLGAPGSSSGSSLEGVVGVWQSTTTGFDTVLVLEERADGRLLGYLPGTSSTRVTDGLRSGTAVTVYLAGEDSGASWEGTYSAVLSGSTLTGAFSDGSSSTALDFQRTAEVLVEERWALFEQATSDQLTVARLEDASGAFVSGDFTAETSCEFLACGGQLTSWVIAGSSHTITTSSGGSCTSASTLTADLDGTPALLTGTYTTTNCSGTSSGEFLGGKAGLVSTTQVREVLQSMATFTDQFEDAAASAVEVFHSSYLHDGKTQADWSSDFSAWWSTYEDISVVVSLEDLIIDEDREVHPFLSGPPRLKLNLQAQGTHSITGTTEVFWDYSPQLPHGMHLALLGTEDDRRVFVGNGELTPFSVGLPLASTDHAATTFCIWPYGVHGGGHPEGHPGIDFEYVAGSDVIAAAAGEVLSVSLNEYHLPDVLYTIIQEARPGVHVIYDEVVDVEPSVTVGAVLASGDVIGSPYDTGSFHMIHFGLRAGGEFLSPADYLDRSAQAQFDTFWSIACYQEEAAEPLHSNPVDITFPLTRVWQRVATGTGQSQAEVHFTRMDPTDYSYAYELVDSSGVTLEWGTVHFNTNVGGCTLQMDPDPSLGLSARYGTYDIIGPQMWLDWDTTSAPPDLGGASLYELVPD